MRDPQITVDGYQVGDRSRLDMHDCVWSLALDQRAFGPRRLIVCCTDRDGRVLGMAHTGRTDPPELALGPCLAHIGAGASAAVAFCDELLSVGPPPPDLGPRFAAARAIAHHHGIHLVDWIACDDRLLRSARFALQPDTEAEGWWDVPAT
ncbi:hypothetical protein K6U06_16105 [Acidiferrimicrobium sp. IK]|uniref:hypothetical protein n=1 Tax=Acidiferrimicrobium sp. IK TaxID=2871700 RepID=UPI0021CB0FFC|nr:hypothetical protein [Acidiferrimicrobium sp. IK]MCU4185894.1 hypothetical protein [Acidiferrimicrobium sp. IK]